MRTHPLHGVRRGQPTMGVAHWQRRLLYAEPASETAAPATAPGFAPDLAPNFAHDVAPQYAPLRMVSSGGRHPLADSALSSSLRRRADEIGAAFDAIEPTLRALAPRQFEDGFAPWAASQLRSQLRLEIPETALRASWTAPLNIAALHARCVLGTFCGLVERAFDRDLAALDDGEPADALIRRWGFHAVDITPCADGRLSGVIDYILRVPPSVVAYRQSTAGALFDVAESLRHWESVELSRWRESRPNAANAPTKFLKIGVYHFSSVDPRHQGCAAHGSDDVRAAGALLTRLQQFEQAVRQTHGRTAVAATLLVGVDTDTDAIRVHVPAADGNTSSGRTDIERYIASNVLYDRTIGMSREAGKEAIRDAVAKCIGVAADDAASEGMRWFCGYLLKNNFGQIEAVREQHGAHYVDAGHTERLLVVGDAVDDVQLRNLAFQAQMNTEEEGSADLRIGIDILRQLHEPSGLAVPVLVHFRHDPRIPGSAEQARSRARRLARAIRYHHADLAARGLLQIQAVVRAGDGAALETVDINVVNETDRDSHV